MTIDEFVNRIGRIGTNLDNITGTALAVAGDLVGQMKANAPSRTGGGTGALRNSISAAVEEGNTRAIYVTMLDYGYFQNYGVQASPSSNTATKFNQTPVEDPVRFALPPSGGDRFRFGVKVEGTKPWGAFYSGLNAIGFFSMAELERKLREGLGRDTTAFIRNNI